MAKFKVGDRVEMVKRDGCYADFKNPGVVKRVLVGSEFLDATDSAGRIFYGADEIRFAAYVEPKPEFLKVGQMVRIVGGGARHKIGNIGEIVDVDFGDDEMSYKVKVGTNSWWQFNKQVEPINDAPKAEKSDKHWIVAKLGFWGQPHPSPNPLKHISESDAVIEAQRLATINPGVKFVMYAARYEAFVEPPKPVEPDLRLRWL